MDKGSVKEFLKGKTILVTGATGFLAKVFVEKILRVQPHVYKIYLLIRASNISLAAERLQNEVMKKELFRVLREKWGAHNFDSFMSEKVVAVAGDICLDNLGIIDANVRKKLVKELDIIVNSAATTRFDERYDIAISINTMGAVHVMNFAKKCCKLQILLHISTAYVCKEAKGIIREEPLQMDQTLNVESEKNLIAQKLNALHAQNADEKTVKFAMKKLGIERANLHGWANTYVFTKAMGEMLLISMKDNLPLIIIRPTIVIGTHSEPFPGWIEGLRTVDSVIAVYGKGETTTFPCHSMTILDTIPGDMVVNAMIIALVAHSKNLSQNFIYHIGSSLRNPLRVSDFVKFIFLYFTKTPLLNKYGEPVATPKNILRAVNMAEFHRHMETRRLQLPPKLLQNFYTENHRKFKSLMHLAEIYEPFAFFEGTFDDKNTENLRIIAKGAADEDGRFNFDPRSINWIDYFINNHIPGLVKSCL